MNEQQRVAFSALCAEWDRVILKRCAVIRKAHQADPTMPRADLYRLTMPHRRQICPSEELKQAAIKAFENNPDRLKRALTYRGYYSAAWELDDMDEKEKALADGGT